MNDPISDMLARIRNANLALLPAVQMPHSKIKESIAAILKREGYISDFAVEGKFPRTIKVKLKYQGKKSVIEGLSRALVNNMVRGVSEGFSKKLELQGVGFKAAVPGKTVNLSLGYSHPVVYDIPEQIKVTVEENTKLTIEGPDRQVVGQVAAEIRSFYPPEPYKGKGVR